MAIYKIYKDGEEVNRITAGEAFVSKYCKKHGCTYEVEEPEQQPETPPEPTMDERMKAIEDSIAGLENALCEMDMANTEAIAAIENALCELDM